jgi:Ring finger domain
MVPPQSGGPAGNSPSGNGPSGSGPSRNGLFGNGPSRNSPSRNSPSRNGPSENGPSGNGLFGNGLFGNGPSRNSPSRNGPSENGPSENGPSGNGPSGNGLFGNGPSRNSPSRNGPSENGPSGNGPSGNGPSGNGLSGNTCGICHNEVTQDDQTSSIHPCGHGDTQGKLHAECVDGYFDGLRRDRRYDGHDVACPICNTAALEIRVLRNGIADSLDTRVEWPQPHQAASGNRGTRSSQVPAPGGSGNDPPAPERSGGSGASEGEGLSSNPLECSICPDVLTPAEACVLKPCAHRTFHYTCIDRWFRSVRQRDNARYWEMEINCPMCRQPVSEVEHNNQTIVVRTQWPWLAAPPRAATRTDSPANPTAGARARAPPPAATTTDSPTNPTTSARAGAPPPAATTTDSPTNPTATNTGSDLFISKCLKIQVIEFFCCLYSLEEVLLLFTQNNHLVLRARQATAHVTPRRFSHPRPPHPPHPRLT